MKNLSILSILLLLLLFGCASNQTAPANATIKQEKFVKAGDTVTVDYVGTLDNGTVFDTSIEEVAKKANLNLRPTYSPMKITAGTGQLIKGFDNALIGMKVNQEKNVHMAPKDAYGEYSQDAIISVPVSSIENGVLAKVGQTVYSNTGLEGIITKTDDENITMDFNHLLAGKALNFKIILRGIE